MPKAGFYAVKRGFKPGIYTTWPECEENTHGFPGALHKKFSTLREAEQFVGVVPIDTSATQQAAEAQLADTSEELASPPQPSPKSSITKPYDKPKPVKQEESVNEELAAVIEEMRWTVVYTDGACQGNGKRGARAGVGVWYGENDARNVSERCPGDQTNNRAELIAIIRCLELEEDPTVPLVIMTDSKYSISCIRDWIPNWIRRGWRSSKGEPVRNKLVIQHLANLLDNRPGRVKLEYVKGHSGNQGNEGADRLAVAGTSKPPLSERVWVTESESAELESAESESAKTTPVLQTSPLAEIQIEDDFPLLSDGEMEQMVADL
ncbi:hypothetical protein FRB94_006961 [Tulasnella sp. JGI-2019a]|nr:hypothetical protein FRB94_006961 [Tulasnella sp. JGI-2019a]